MGCKTYKVNKLRLSGPSDNLLKVILPPLCYKKAKYHFERLRPDFYHQVCGEALRQLPDPSFPSGHVMASLALASAAGILGWRTRWRWVGWGIGLLFALGVAWSRLYLAAHYPSDVLAGWFATGGWVGSLYLAFARYLPTLRPLGLQPGLPTIRGG